MQPSDVKDSALLGLTRNIVILGFASFFTDTSSEMVFALLPFFMTTVLGMNMTLVGIVEGAAETASSLLKAFSGWVSDRIRSRKMLVAAGYSLSSLTKPFFGLAMAPLHVISIRVLDRIGKGVRTSPRDALIADSIDESIRGKAYGFHRSLDSFGAVLGPLLAFLLFPLFWYRGVFLLSIIPGILSVLLLVFLIKEKKTDIAHAVSRVRVGFRSLGRRFRLYLLIVATFTFSNLSYAFFLLRAQDFGVTASHAPLLYLLFNFVYATSAFPVGYASDRIGKWRLLLFGYAMFGVVCSGFALATALPHIIALFVAYGVSYAFADTLQRAIVPDIVGRELRGTAFGALHTSIGITALPSGILAGTLWQVFGASVTFFFAAAAAFLSAVILAIATKTRQCD